MTRVTLLSDRALVERLAQTPFLDFTAQQLGLLEVVSLVLFAGMAWLGDGTLAHAALRTDRRDSQAGVSPRNGMRSSSTA